MDLDYLNKAFPNWHLYPPPGRYRVLHLTDHLGFSTAPPVPFTGDQFDLCVYRSPPTDITVIHQIGLKAQVPVLRDGVTFFEELSSGSILGKFSWQLRVSNTPNDLTTRHGSRAPEAQGAGIVTLQDLSYQRGNFYPVVAAPGSEIKIQLTGLDPAAGSTIPVDSLLFASISGYRILHQSRRGAGV